MPTALAARVKDRNVPQGTAPVALFVPICTFLGCHGEGSRNEADCFGL